MVGWELFPLSYNSGSCNYSNDWKALGLPGFLIPGFYRAFNEARNYPIAALLGPWIGTLLWPTDAWPGHQDYIDTPHRGTHGLIREGLYAFTRILAVSQC